MMRTGTMNKSMWAMPIAMTCALACGGADREAAGQSVGVTITPNSADLAAAETEQFTGAVIGAVNTALTWSIQEGATGGTVTSTGLYTASSTAGTYHVVVTSQADSSKTASATVVVSSPADVSVAISPKIVTLPVRGSQKFTCTATGSSNTACTWSVTEGTAGGSVDGTGTYTAPATAGTYHVVAKSSADPTRSDTATVTVSTGWVLVWADEFDGTAIDPAQWHVQDVFDTSNPDYETAFDYSLEAGESPAAVSVSGGQLHITTSAPRYGTYPHTTGGVTTRHHPLKFKYGRLEIRARFPKTQGYWPALWLLTEERDAQGWATYEIDLVEILGNDPTNLHQNVHNYPASSPGGQVVGVDMSLAMHTYLLEWDATGVRMYFDGTQTYSTGSSNSPTLPMYLLINTALGGSWSGSTNSSTVYPQTLDVDYVRLYQRG
jgi:beta-glucanase (GH16 family)